MCWVGHFSGGCPLNKFPNKFTKDYIQANREMNSRVLGTVKQKWGSGSKLYVRGWLYVFLAFLVLNYAVPFAWGYVSAFFR